MRFAAAFALLLVGLSCATASVIVATPLRKGQSRSCQAPINQVSCRIEPNGNIQGFWTGAWGETGDKPAYGMLPRCVTGNAAANILPANTGTVDAGVMTFVTGVEVCYGFNKRIKKITWNTQQYNVAWTTVGTNPPQADVSPVAGSQTAVNCVSTTKPNPVCKIVVKYNAPEGKVLGGLYAKCGYSQGFEKYGKGTTASGTYKPRYFLKDISAACSVFPAGYVKPAAR